MKKIIYILIILVIAACQHKKEGIYVDINKNIPVSFFDIFDKLEIIQLETNSKSLIKELSKVISYRNRYYILDRALSQIYIFDSMGRFIHTINNKGAGPEEYIHIADFSLDTINQSLTLLSAVDRAFHMYDLNGKFISRQKLPTITGAYMNYKYINSDLIVFWTSDENNRIKLYDWKQNSIINECYPEDSKSFNGHDVTLPYNNLICRPFDNTIYSISMQGTISEAYTWDFGRFNNIKVKERPQIRSAQEQIEFLQNIYNSKIVNYILNLHGGNNTYRYVQIYRHNAPINIFYNNNDANTNVFEKTAEGAYIHPVFWEEEYILGTESWQYFLKDMAPDDILDEPNLRIKRSINELDNPILFKYYFKK